MNNFVSGLFILFKSCIIYILKVYTDCCTVFYKICCEVFSKKVNGYKIPLTVAADGIKRISIETKKERKGMRGRNICG